MAERLRVSSGSPYEARFGFARAVRAGRHVYVAGTAPIEPDGSVTPGGMGPQARRCLAIIGQALAEAGASPADVVRTRIYVTDMSQWQAAAEAHAEAFAAVRPAATIVEVAGLVDPAMLVEIEAEALVGDEAAG